MTSGCESSEDYLEAILVIRAERGFCRNVDIAERMGVTKAMATFLSQSLMEAVDRDVRLAQGGLETNCAWVFISIIVIYIPITDKFLIPTQLLYLCMTCSLARFI